MRITIGLLLLTLPEVHAAPALAVDHAGARLWGFVPVDPAAAQVARVLLVAGALSGACGVAPRAAFAICTAAGLYLLGIPHLRGATIHYHHLLWLSAILAVAPSGDALSPIARLGPAPSVAYGLPVRLAAALLGLVYLFPGLHKLAAAGIAWDPTDHMYWKWAAAQDFVPLFVPDPVLLRIGGASVVVFEIAFLPMALIGRLRGVAVASGLAFHAATAALFGIRFSSLWLCYAILLPWDRLAGSDRTQGPHRSTRASAAVGLALILCASAVGAAGRTQGWPFACYPTFDRAPGRHMPGLAIAWVDVLGVEREVPMSAWGPPQDSQRLWGEVWRVSGVRGDLDPDGLGRLWARIAEHNGIAPERVARVRFYRAVLDVTPGTGGWSRGKLLHVDPAGP